MIQYDPDMSMFHLEISKNKDLSIAEACTPGGSVLHILNEIPNNIELIEVMQQWIYKESQPAVHYGRELAAVPVVNRL